MDHTRSILDQGPVVALSGRSNVGKSSLINRLVGRRVARVSQTPGCTRQINFYPSGEEWKWADLPGYGYARMSQKARLAWQDEMRHFLRVERPLTCVIIDSRIPPQRLDQAWVNWLVDEELSFIILANKVDVLSQREFFHQKAVLSQAFPAPLYWGWISVKTGEGLAAFQEWLRRYFGFGG